MNEMIIIVFPYVTTNSKFKKLSGVGVVLSIAPLIGGVSFKVRPVVRYHARIDIISI